MTLVEALIPIQSGEVRLYSSYDRYSSISRDRYLGDIHHKTNFDHNSLKLRVARKKFVEARVKLQLNGNSSHKEIVEESKKNYVAEFESEVEAAQILDGEYRFFHLVGSVRGEVLSIGQSLLRHFDIDAELPVHHVVDEYVASASAKIRSEMPGCQSSYVKIAGLALDMVSSSVHL